MINPLQDSVGPALVVTASLIIGAVHKQQQSKRRQQKRKIHAATKGGQRKPPDDRGGEDVNFANDELWPSTAQCDDANIMVEGDVAQAEEEKLKTPETIGRELLGPNREHWPRGCTGHPTPSKIDHRRRRIVRWARKRLRR